MGMEIGELSNGGMSDGLPPTIRRRFYAIPLLLLAFLPLSTAAQTSDVVDRLVQQRTQTRVAELLEELGDKVRPRTHEEMFTLTSYWMWMEQNFARQEAVADSLSAAEELAIALANAFGTSTITWRKYSAENQGEFLERHREVFWRAIGAYHPQDTLSTSHFRAHLNGLFGAPTRNAAAMEQEEYAGSEYVQFEYWLIANDSIAVLVMDTDGPFGRGLLVAADEAYLDHFVTLKDDLFNRILESSPAPFADYYHSLSDREWYRTGYDGTEYFTRETRRPRWATRRSREEKWRIFR